MKEITLKELFNTQAHLGHLKTYRHPDMRKYIHCTHHCQDIINLEVTLQQIDNSKKLINTFRKEDILLISKRYQSNDIEIKQCKKWKAGTITNKKYGAYANLELPKLILMDSKFDNIIALKEANKYNIPVIALCDTNSSLKAVTNPIVMNDDNEKSIKIVFNYLLN